MKLKDKSILFITIIVLTVFYALPSIFLTLQLGYLYTPLTANSPAPFARDEGYAYAPFVNYILKGNVSVGEVYSKEYSNYPTPFKGETLPSVILAFFTKVFGSVEKAFIVSDIIFPPLIFLLLYKITKLFTEKTLLATSIAFVATVSRDFIAVIPFPHLIIQLLTFQEGQNFPLFLSRAFHPQVTFPIFLLFVLSVFNQLKDPQSKTKVLLTGLFLGALFYSYIFYWTYALFFLGLLFMFMLLQKKLDIAKNIFLSGLIAALIALPYLFNMFNFYNTEIAADFVNKASLPGLPFPLTVLRYLAIIVIFWIVLRKKNSYVNTFVILLLAGILIAPVTKLLLGQDLETFHYLRRALMPLATLSIFIVFFKSFEKYIKLQKVIALLLLLLFSVYAINAQITSSKITKKVLTKNQDERLVFHWLKEHAKKEDVVGSLDTDFNLFIPVYTKSFTYFPPTDRTVMPANEGVQRFIILSNLLGVEKENQKENMVNILSYLFIYQAYNKDHDLDPNSPKRYEAESEIENFDVNSLSLQLNRYELDYLVLTPQHLKLSSPNLTHLEPYVVINEYIIFKVKK